MVTVEEILMVKGPDVIVASPGTTVADAARLMAHADVGSIIITEDGRVVGVFTERDLLKRVVARGIDPGETELREVMSWPVKGCRLGDSVRDCAERLTSERFRHMAVIEDGALVGLIGLRDVMAARMREAEQLISELELQCRR